MCKSQTIDREKDRDRKRQTEVVSDTKDTADRQRETEAESERALQTDCLQEKINRQAERDRGGEREGIAN